MMLAAASAAILDRHRQRATIGGSMGWGIGIGGALLYFVVAFTLGGMTLRNGHGVMFFLGIFFPVLWIFGAFMRPAGRMASGEPRGAPADGGPFRRGRASGGARRAAGVPPAREADRRGLQSRLRLLLLPLEGDAVSRVTLPDGGRVARDIPAAADRGACG